MKSPPYTQTATFYVIPSTATDESEKTAVATGIRCSEAFPPVSGIYAIGKQYQERENLAQLVQSKILYCDVPDVVINNAMRVQVAGEEYGIKDITHWRSPYLSYLEILLEKEI